MAFRNIIIENPAYISIRNSQLVIRTDAEHSVALEDISALLLENRQSTITTAALSQLGQRGCAVFVCDEKHMPCAVLSPFHQYVRELSVLRNQLAMSEPRKKRLWQQIVQEKIRNQAICLQLAEKPEQAERLQNMIRGVCSGDSGNVEAAAAQAYFPALFGAAFTRDDDNGWNSALNYGYAILRGCMARMLAAYGFLPALGLHHRSTLNPFNLADDLMEAFRPLVDLLVFREIGETDELVPKAKRMLFNCLNLDVLSGEKHHSTAYAIERTVQSLSKAMEAKEAELMLPRLIDLKQHCYE